MKNNKKIVAIKKFINIFLSSTSFKGQSLFLSHSLSFPLNKCHTPRRCSLPKEYWVQTVIFLFCLTNEDLSDSNRSTPHGQCSCTLSHRLEIISHSYNDLVFAYLSHFAHFFSLSTSTFKMIVGEDNINIYIKVGKFLATCQPLIKNFQPKSYNTRQILLLRFGINFFSLQFR